MPLIRLMEDCVAKAEAVVLNDVGVPVEGFEELLRKGLEGGCPPLSSSCLTAVKAYKECVVEKCMRECERKHGRGHWCERGYWVCLAKCSADHGAPEVSTNIGSLLLAGLI